MPEIIENLVSTIIPVRNRPEMIIKAVESVLEQTYRPIEVIIVDDGSTDETPSVCKKIKSEHPKHIHVTLQKQSGAGLARERGRQLARGEFIQYLDSDDLLLSNKFDDQVRALRENPDCGVAYGKTRLIDESGQILVEPFKWTGKTISKLFPLLLVDRWWCTHTPLYRRSVCDAVGAWTALKYSQDWEYDGRVGAINSRLVSTGTYVSVHITHKGQRQTGHGRWLQPADQIKFFESLYDSARAGGVVHEDPEMQHFSRWVFSKAREVGAKGDTIPAQLLFSLAVRAGGGEDKVLQLYGIAGQFFGWKFTATLSNWITRFLRRKPGKRTLFQSWM